jgi:diguanylate cyclase (GGDEF)-like protein
MSVVHARPNEVPEFGREPLSARWMIALSLGVTLSFCVVCAAVLWEMRDADRKQANETSRHLVAAIAADIARNIELYDLSLQAVAEGLQLPEIHQVSRQVQQLILFDRAATAKHLGSIRVLDADGKMILDSKNLTPEPRNLAGREYFQFHQHASDPALHIGAPEAGPKGKYHIGLSRRLSHPDGSFAGVVVGTLQFSYLHQLFEHVGLPDGSVITLMRTDGIVMMRAPFQGIGLDLSETDIFRRASSAASSQFEATAPIDGVQRLYAFQRLGELPLRVGLGLPLDTLYAGWREKAWRIGLVIFGLCTATLGLAIVWTKELRRRTAAEQELSLLATTDSLTGLSNRRHFDLGLEQEWRRAARAGGSLTLLMIDADHFKAYNDAQGHQSGDRLLQEIAGCIAWNARRAGDLRARYGGEEFAVLLPGTSAADGWRVAEQIRSSIAKLATMGHPEHAVTVSVGLACMVPQPGREAQDLISAADLALYQAKRNGRNCTVCAPILAEVPVVPTQTDHAGVASGEKNFVA